MLSIRKRWLSGGCSLKGCVCVFVSVNADIGGNDEIKWQGIVWSFYPSSRCLLFCRLSSYVYSHYSSLTRHEAHQWGVMKRFEWQLRSEEQNDRAVPGGGPRCSRAAGHEPSHLHGQQTRCLCCLRNNNPELWPWHHTVGDLVASNSMAANGTECVRQNTLAGASRSKSHLVKEVVLCLLFPFTSSDTEMFRETSEWSVAVVAVIVEK